MTNLTFQASSLRALVRQMLPSAESKNMSEFRPAPHARRENPHGADREHNHDVRRELARRKSKEKGGPLPPFLFTKEEK